MEVITYKCPNCGGDLTFDPASGKYKCEYCLSSFTQEEAEKANPKAAEALNGETMLPVHRKHPMHRRKAVRRKQKGKQSRAKQLSTPARTAAPRL